MKTSLDEQQWLNVKMYVSKKTEAEHLRDRDLRTRLGAIADYGPKFIGVGSPHHALSDELLAEALKYSRRFQ